MREEDSDWRLFNGVSVHANYELANCDHGLLVDL